MIQVLGIETLRLATGLLWFATLSLSQDCSPESDGYGPQVRPDTIANFKSYAAFQQAAQSAPTPSGYEETFRDLDASISDPDGTYITLHYLESYNTGICANFCNEVSGCIGFNIYIERDPSVIPASSCPDPPSITKYGCTLWGSPINATVATQTGQFQEQFQVIIVASNGYQQSAGSPPQPTTSVTSSIASGLVTPTESTITASGTFANHQSSVNTQKASSTSIVMSTVSHTTKTIASAAAEAPTSTSVTATVGSTTSSGLSTGAKAGIGVGVGLLVVIVIAAIGILVMRRRKNATTPDTLPPVEKDATGRSPALLEAPLAQYGAPWKVEHPAELHSPEAVHELPSGEKYKGPSELQGSTKEDS